MEHLSLNNSAALHHPIPHHAPISIPRAKAQWSTPITMQAFVQRLSLMVELELPCAICLGHNGNDRSCHGVIKRCSWHDGKLSLCGDGFSLHLIVDHIGSLHLAHRRGSEGNETALEIFDTTGALIARILGTPDPQRAAVWQDIMDSFTLVAA